MVAPEHDDLRVQAEALEALVRLARLEADRAEAARSRLAERVAAARRRVRPVRRHTRGVGMLVAVVLALGLGSFAMASALRPATAEIEHGPPAAQERVIEVCGSDAECGPNALCSNDPGFGGRCVPIWPGGSTKRKVTSVPGR